MNTSSLVVKVFSYVIFYHTFPVPPRIVRIFNYCSGGIHMHTFSKIVLSLLIVFITLLVTSCFNQNSVDPVTEVPNDSSEATSEPNVSEVSSNRDLKSSQSKTETESSLAHDVPIISSLDQNLTGSSAQVNKGSSNKYDIEDRFISSMQSIADAGSSNSILKESSTTVNISSTPIEISSTALMSSMQLELSSSEDEGWDFYLEIGGDAKKEYDGFIEDGNTEDAKLIASIAFTPIAHWFGEWFDTGVIESRVDALLSGADEQGKPAVIVLYAIVGRDCDAYSSGGMETEVDYLAWITNVAKSFNGRSPWVILEPDGLAMLGECEMGDRVGMMRKASEILTTAGGRVYVDLANSGWKSVEERIALIDSIGTEFIHGFASNVANTETLENEIADGEAIAKATGTRYVVDTGRNGNGSNGEWCNPEGRALGELPRMVNRGALDAYLWIKGPGWSDGECNDGPVAGEWFANYALELARNAGDNE